MLYACYRELMAVLVCFCCFQGTALVAGEAVETFSDLARFSVVQGGERRQSLQRDPTLERIYFQFAEEQKVPAMEILIPENKGRRRLPDIPVTLVLTVSHSTPEPFNNIALRISDRENETFHFLPVKKIADGNGKTVFHYLVDQTTFRISWGPRINRMFDFPVAFQGIAVNFNPQVHQGRICFEKLEILENGRREIPVKTSLLRFQKKLVMDEVRAVDGKCRALPLADGIQLSGNASEVHVDPYAWRHPLPVPGPTEVRLDLEVVRGNGIIELEVEDLHKKRIVFSAPFSETARTELVIPTAGRSAANQEIKYRRLRVKFNSKQEFDLKLFGLRQSAMVSDVQALHCDIETGNGIHVLDVGEEGKFRLTFSNRSDSPLEWEVEMNFRDFLGHNFIRKENIKLAAGGSVRLPLTQKLPYFGIWNIHYSIRSKKERGIQRDLLRTFAYMKPFNVTPRCPEGTFMFGVNAHPTWLYSMDEYPLFVEAMARCGAKLLRTDFSWRQIEPFEGKFDFSIYDPLVEDMIRNGIAVLAVLHPTPMWAVPAERANLDYFTKSRSRPLPGLYRRFARQVAKHYGDKITFWEIWNEPDLLPVSTLTTDEYLEILREGAEGIRQSCPDARIMTGGFAVVDSPAVSQKDLQYRVLTEGKKWYDIHAIHLHGPFPEYADIVDNQLIPLRTRAGVTAPWFSAETSLNASGGAERIQALTLFKKIMFSWSRGSISYIWYNLRNKGRDFYNGEHHYGLLTYDFYPNPAFSVFAELSRLYTGLKYEREWKIQAGIYCFQFEGAGRKVICAWNENSADVSRPVVFKTDASKVYRVDIMGNKSPIALKEGIAVCPISAVPGSIVLENATSIEPVNSLLTVEAPRAITPGRPFKVAISAFNPYQSKAVLRLHFRLPKGMEMTQPVSSNKMTPGSSLRKSFDMKLNSTSLAAVSRDLQVAVSYELDEIKGTINIPFSRSVLISGRDFDKREPDFWLESVDQIFPLIPADPLTEFRNWKGIADLSAKVWYGVRNENLTVRVVVQDDKHCQPYSEDSVWNGDNIQMPLVFPGQNGGIWEIGMSLLDDGRSEIWIWSTPPGFDARKCAREILLNVSRRKNLTTYDIQIPFATLGISSADLRKGFQSNILINENDGDGRDYCLFIAPGTNTTKLPDQYPFLILE